MTYKKRDTSLKFRKIGEKRDNLVSFKRAVLELYP